MNETIVTRQPRKGRWLRVKDIPLSVGMVYYLIRENLIESVILRKPGGKKGARIIDAESLDRYLEGLKGQELTPWKPPGRKKNKQQKEPVS